MTITRRGFLGMAGVAGVAGLAAGAGLAGCAPAPEKATPVAATGDEAASGAAYEAAATYTCDICICGAGNSGLSAAVEAAQQGLGVVVLEKHGGTGGGGIGTEGVFAVNSQMQQDANISIKPAEIISCEMEYSHNRANGLKWLDLVQASGENIAWLQECGVNFTGVVDDYHGGMFQTFHWFGENRAHDDFSPAMTETARSLGVEFLLNCPAVELVMDNGAVAGVWAQKLNGDYVLVKARAVVLATGGFANNNEYLQEGGFSDTTNVKRFLYGYDGDGVRMALEAGGASNVPRMSGLMQLTVQGAPGGEYGTFGRGDGLVVAGHNPCAIWINEDGQRFCAESAGIENWMADMIPSLAHHKLYSIYDAKIFKDAYDGMIMPRIDWAATQEELAQRIEENPYDDFFSADTLEELAKKASDALGLDYDTVIASINGYNEMCEAGDDAHFGKPKEYQPAVLLLLHAPGVHGHLRRHSHQSQDGGGHQGGRGHSRPVLGGRGFGGSVAEHLHHQRARRHQRQQHQFGPLRQQERRGLHRQREGGRGVVRGRYESVGGRAHVEDAGRQSEGRHLHRYPVRHVQRHRGDRHGGWRQDRRDQAGKRA